MKIQNPKLLIFSIVISQAAGLLGSIATTPAIPNWYANLNKPVFNPPSFIFAPVWTALYTLMGISLYLIWVRGLDKSLNKKAVIVFFVHLAVNSIWSLIFFGLKNLSLAFLVIVVLWLIIVYLVKIFYRIDKRASYLLFPYLAWVSFASLLNFSIWQLN